MFVGLFSMYKPGFYPIIPKENKCLNISDDTVCLMDKFRIVITYDVTTKLIRVFPSYSMGTSYPLGTPGLQWWLTSLEWSQEQENKTTEQNLPFSSSVFILLSFCSITIINQSSYNFFFRTISIYLIFLLFLSPFHNFP